MHGGTNSIGRWCTLAVSGLYSMSWNSSFSNTTAPSLVATLRPTSNTISSVCDTGPLRRSLHSCCMPCATLSPLVSSAFFCASGFSARKLAGLIASTHCCTAKRMRALVLASPSIDSASCISVRAFSRYICAV